MQTTTFLAFSIVPYISCIAVAVRSKVFKARPGWLNSILYLFSFVGHDSCLSLKSPSSSAGVIHARAPSYNHNVSTAPYNWSHQHRAIRSTSAIGAAQHNNLVSLTDVPQSNASSEASIIATRPATFRHSLEMKNMDQKYTDPAADAPVPTNNGSVLATPPKLQPSFSANDIPTLKSVSGSTVGSGPNQAAQQHLHNHNASMGRIPAGALPSRHSRELSGDARDNVAGANYQSIGSSLHANAPSFGPALAQPSNVLQGPVLTQPSQTPVPPIMGPGQAMTPYNGNNGGYYAPNGYGNVGPANGGANYHGMPLLAQMQGLSLNGGGNTYSAQNYTGYAPVYAPHQPRDSQQRIMANRRQQDNEGKPA